MLSKMDISLFDLIMCLSDTMDLINKNLSNHHKKTAYIACCIAEEMHLPINHLNDILIAASLHDIGALTLSEKLKALDFEGTDLHTHGELGFLLLKTFSYFEKVSVLVKFHHVFWKDGEGAEFKGKTVPLGSHIIHLADRIDTLIKKNENILTQASVIREAINKQSGKMFIPELVKAFNSLSKKEFFWLDIVSPFLEKTLSRKYQLPIFQLNIDNLISLVKLFSRIIDFRSKFTSTHSSGVAASSKALAKLVGFSGNECQLIEFAGYLHDLGKLVVPIEILEKPGKLTKQEYEVMKSHTFYTYRSLERVKAFDTINLWSSFHHERLNGKGYPFHCSSKDIPLGSRIVAVADVFTAITEDRPYRKGMEDEQALKILQDMADKRELDSSLVELIKSNYDHVNNIRIEAQDKSTQEYNKFIS